MLFGKSPKLPVHALNHYLQKRKLQAPTRAHDLLFWPKKIWPTLLFPRFTPENTFPKFPVHTLINDPPPKKKLQASTRTHDPFLTTQKFDSLSFKYTKNTNLENIKVGQISFLNLATFKSAQVPWTYFFLILRVLLWNEHENLHELSETFDTILCADWYIPYLYTQNILTSILYISRAANKFTVISIY